MEITCLSITRTATFVGGLFFAVSLSAQSPLDDYIHEGLEDNLVLRQKEISLAQAEEALHIARSWFLPSVSLLSDYTSGKGGRNIAIPIGDLLNPVYASLNQLTQSDAFPQVGNVSQDFFPYNFIDTRIRTSVPLINSDLHINKTIEKQKTQLQEFELRSYKRQLVFDIKSAYYRCLSAEAAVRIYESALGLVEKNVTVNEALLRNGKNLPANLLRARSEYANVEADLNDTRVRAANAKKYLNFLLNKPLNSPVITDFTIPEDTLPAMLEASISKREELAMIQTNREIQASVLQMHKLSRLPKVNAFVDFGAQASNWNFNHESKYYLAGIQLSLPLFQGFRTNMHIRRDRLELERSDLDIKNSTAQIQLAAEIAGNEVMVASQNLQAAREQLRSSRSYFSLIDKGFREGIHSQIEFIDARNQLTTAELNVSLRFFDMLIATARFERETSAYEL